MKDTSSYLNLFRAIPLTSAWQTPLWSVPAAVPPAALPAPPVAPWLCSLPLPGLCRIPSTVSIGKGAFAACFSLVSVGIPDSVNQHRGPHFRWMHVINLLAEEGLPIPALETRAREIPTQHPIPQRIDDLPVRAHDIHRLEGVVAQIVQGPRIVGRGSFCVF